MYATQRAGSKACLLCLSYFSRLGCSVHKLHLKHSSVSSDLCNGSVTEAEGASRPSTCSSEEEIESLHVCPRDEHSEREGEPRVSTEMLKQRQHFECRLSLKTHD